MSGRWHLKVLFVNDTAFVVSTLEPELLKLGIEASVVGHRPADPALGREAFARVFLQSASAILKKEAYDLLHINYGLFGTLGWLSRKPTLLHLHGSDIRAGESVRSRIANMLSRRSARRADEVWYSTVDLSPYLDGLGVPCTYIPNPVAAPFFLVPPPCPERPHVLFAVPLTPLKGADLAIEAIHLLVREVPELPISAFGFGPNMNLARQMRDRIPRNVRILPWIPHGKMPALFSEATIVVGRFRLGSLGITELEAMAAGRPLISEIPPSYSVLEPYYREDPPVFCCRDPMSVAETVLHLIEHSAVAERVGAESRRWAERYHSTSIVARLYLQRYREMLDTWRPA